MKHQSVRLPSHIKPESYKIMIKPDLEGFTFEGEETIKLIIERPVREITLHAKEIKIESARLHTTPSRFASHPSSLRRGKLHSESPTFKYNPKAETVTFKFDGQIPKGKVELEIKFTGILNDLMRGFYRSKYFYDGKEKYMATTQFEATDARRAFPCVDEPAAKAVFDVTLMIPGHTTAISNTIETEIAEHQSGYKVVKFQPTPKMSTYLLAFIVGEFEYIEGWARRGGSRPSPTGDDKTLVRIFVTPGKKHQAKFALDTAIKCLEFYNKYFDIPYPLPVMDLIAIPDFTSAAMENWGAITYRETALLVDDEHTSASNKQWVAIVIAHEIAHQWFGNLVTMEWWTDLWLNEGFASYMENFCVDKLFPQWDIWKQYVSGRYATALKLDALANSHPIEVEVHHPDEINEIFDMVSYAKGSAVIRMLANYLGETKFRDGLRYYLKKHSYGNAITHDLWKAFEKVSGKPVRKIMEVWTKNTGYPLLSVRDNKNKLEVSQRRFFSSELSQKSLKDNTLWPVPLEVLGSGGKIEKSFLTKKKSILKRAKGWTKFNYNENGFYRVEYTPEMLAELKTAVKNRKLDAQDRLGIVRDIFALCEAGQFSTAETLRFVQSYSNEDDLTVWEEISGGMFSVRQLIAEEKFLPQFDAFARELYAPIAKKMGWEKKKREPHTQGLLRSLALYQFGASGDRQTVLHAQELFKKSVISKKFIPADIRGVVYNLVSENGTLRDFDQLTKMYKSTDVHEEQERLGRSLGGFKDRKLLQKTLEFAVSKHVRPQDSPSIAIMVGRNVQGRDLQWKFVQNKWDMLTKRYGHGGHLLEWFIAPLARYASTEKAKEIEEFFKKHPAPGLARTIQQNLERIRSNALWLKRARKELTEFFNR